jgi:hypothetical protein
MKKLNSFKAIAFALFLATITPISAQSATCPPSSVDGKTIGKIEVGKVAINLKTVKYPKGGNLNPPRSPLNAGLSARHMPLNSDLGTSVIAWHVNYNGCVGKLNVINNKPVGFEFSVSDENGVSTKYRITEKFSVKKGNYEAEWFDLSGPRRLLLVTCTGKVVNGSYQKNLILVAEPVV